jgi:hypothetical protein
VSGTGQILELMKLATQEGDQLWQILANPETSFHLEEEQKAAIRRNLKSFMRLRLILLDELARRIQEHDEYRKNEAVDSKQ